MAEPILPHAHQRSSGADDQAGIGHYRFARDRASKAIALELFAESRSSLHPLFPLADGKSLGEAPNDVKNK